MNTKIKTRIAIVLLLLGMSIGNAFSQIITNGATSTGITGENAFLDLSASFHDYFSTSSIGKGLAFPQADLTGWAFTATVSSGSFPSFLDGMIVYNSGTGNTPTTQVTKSTYVTPGFYYFSNPTGADNFSIADGEWLRLTNNIDLLAKTVSVSAEAPTDPDPQDGWVYFDTDDNTMYRYDGSAWNAVSSMASAADSGASNPTVSGDETLGDMYVNTTYNTVWVYDGSAWQQMLSQVYSDNSLAGDGTTTSLLKVADGGISPIKLAGITGNGTGGQILTSAGGGYFAWVDADDIAGGGVTSSATAPTSPTAGDIYYNTTDQNLYYYDGSSWGMVNGVETGTTAPTDGSGTEGETYYNTTTDTYYVYGSDGTWHEVGGTAGTVTAVTSATTNQLTVANGTSTPALSIVTGAVASGSTALATGDQINTFVTAQLGSKLDVNAAITGATKTKITYDANGLVTAGADATTADIAPSANRNYVTDAQLTTISSMGTVSGTNTGDVSLAGQSYLSLSGQTITANAVDLSGTNATGILAAARFPALTGVVTTTAGSLTTSIANNAISASNLKGGEGAALANGAQYNVLQSNGDGTFSWLDITDGIEVSADASTLALPFGQFYMGDSEGKAAATAKNLITINGFAPAEADIAMGNASVQHKITYLAEPTAGQDAATKNYVDTQVSASAGLASISVDGTTIVGDGTSTTPLRVPDGGLTFAKLPSIAASSLLGRSSNTGAGAPQQITLGTGLSMSSSTLSVASQLAYTATATTGSLSLPISTNPVTIPVATASFGGLMSAADKATLDGLSSGGSYTLPNASASVLGGIKVGTNLSIDANGVLSAAGGGSGTVTNVSVVTNDGVSGTVATSTTTPAITLELGNITPTSISTGTISSGAITSTGTITSTSISTGTISSGAITSTGDITTTGDLTVNDLTVNGTINGSIASAVSVTGVVGIANGGTGASTLAGAQASLGIDLMIPSAEKGAANGVVPLNSSSKIDESYLPASLTGGVSFQGAYDVASNSPTLAAASSSNTGYYYIASTAGTTTYNSITLAVGDWLISDGSSWSKISGGSSVSSVFGRTGAILPVSGDYNTGLVTENATNLYYTTARAALKEDVANKSTNVTTDASSDTKYPSVKAVKTYVDAKVPTATASNSGQVLTVNASGIPGWATPSSSSISLTGAVTGSGTSSIATTLGASVVGSTNITDLSIAAADIANQTITATKLKGITTNGTSGYSLTSDGSGGFAWSNISGGGSGTTNLGYTAAATTGEVTSSTGTSATIPAATTVAAGLMKATDKTKLDNIADFSGSSADASKVLTMNSTGTAATWVTPAASGGSSGGGQEYYQKTFDTGTSQYHIVVNGSGNLSDIEVTHGYEDAPMSYGFYITIPTGTVLTSIQISVPKTSTALLGEFAKESGQFFLDIKDTDLRINTNWTNVMFPTVSVWTLNASYPNGTGDIVMAEGVIGSVQTYTLGGGEFLAVYYTTSITASLANVGLSVIMKF